MLENTEIVVLLKKKIDNSISKQELMKLHMWANEHPDHNALLRRVEDGSTLMKDILIMLEYMEQRDKETRERIQQRTLSKKREGKEIKVDRKRPSIMQVLAYSAVLLLVAMPVYFFLVKEEKKEEYRLIYDLNPGSNKATIRFSNGKYVELPNQLDSAEQMAYLTEVSKGKAGNKPKEEVIMAELSTPKGGKYHFALPDGTKVWLNAASTLTFPTRFIGNKRVVQLEGEAYFEVLSQKDADNNKMPFFVQTADQEVSVIGTKFNITAYRDQKDIKTTLLEGAVAVQSANKTLVLKPGEQSKLNKTGFSKMMVDLDQQLAWKNNEFVFFETELKEAMQELSRWYNFEVVYEKGLPNIYLYAQIKRDKTLAEVFEIMKLSDLKFKIEKQGQNNRVTILN